MPDDDDDESQKPQLRLISENPNAATNKAVRETEGAKIEAEAALRRAAVSILRVMAGSNATSYDVYADLVAAIVAQDALRELSGKHSSAFDVQSALALSNTDLPSEASDARYSEWRRERGYELIVQGALRLAAHWILGEDPHFGGKYSKRLVDRGMDMIAAAFKPKPAQESKAMRAALDAGAKLLADRIGNKARRTKPKKRWSSRDSRSYLDPEPGKSDLEEE